LNLTTLWHRETELAGAYAYGTETLADGRRVRTFDLAFALVREAKLGRLVSATYPLADYKGAIEHAANAGPRRAVRVAFDMRPRKERNRGHGPGSGSSPARRRETADASARVRPRRRPLHASDAVLARRGVSPREAAGRPLPGDLPTRAAGRHQGHRR